LQIRFIFFFVFIREGNFETIHVQHSNQKFRISPKNLGKSLVALFLISIQSYSCSSTRFCRLLLLQLLLHAGIRLSRCGADSKRKFFPRGRMHLNLILQLIYILSFCNFFSAFMLLFALLDLFALKFSIIIIIIIRSFALKSHVQYWVGSPDRSPSTQCDLLWHETTVTPHVGPRSHKARFLCDYEALPGPTSSQCYGDGFNLLHDIERNLGMWGMESLVDAI
jgi:hypothetical protein